MATTMSSSLSSSPSSPQAVFATATLVTPAASPTSPSLMATDATNSNINTTANTNASASASATGNGNAKVTRRTQIARIGDERLRRSALLKRRHGLYKKATELATLCDCQVAILIFDSNDRLHHYSTTDNVDDVLLRYASHYRPALDVRTAREYNGSPDSGARPTTTGTHVLGGNLDASNPSAFISTNQAMGNVSTLLGFSPSDPTPVDADAMLYNLADDDDRDDDDLAMVTSPVFAPAVPPADPSLTLQSGPPQMVLSESGASFVQQPLANVPQLARQLSGSGSAASRRAAASGIPIPTPLQIPLGQSPLGGGTLAMSPMSLPTQSPFFSAFDMMALNSPRVPSSTTPTDVGGNVALTRVPSTKKRRIDAVMHSDSAYVPNSPMFTPSLLATSHPVPPLPPALMSRQNGTAGSAMSIDGTGSFTHGNAWLPNTNLGNATAPAGSMTPFQLPFTQTPTEMAADLMYTMPPSGTLPALPGSTKLASAMAATQFMSPMMMATSVGGTPVQPPMGAAMMTPLTMPADSIGSAGPFMSAGAGLPATSSEGLLHPPLSEVAVGDTNGTTTGGGPTSTVPLRLPPTRSLSAVFPDISLSEYLHAHPPHPVTGGAGEALVGTLAWDSQAEVVAPSKDVPDVTAPATATGSSFAPERVMSLDLLLNSFPPTAAAGATEPANGPHPLHQATSIFDFGSPRGFVADPEDDGDEEVQFMSPDIAPAASATGPVTNLGSQRHPDQESEEDKRKKNAMAWPLLG